MDLVVPGFAGANEIVSRAVELSIRIGVPESEIFCALGFLKTDQIWGNEERFLDITKLL